MEAKKTEGFLEALARLVKDGFLTVTEAAKRAEMSTTEFQAKTKGLL
jgi:hypothetical protein